MSRDVITAPCIVGDMDEDWYHADPVEGGSLSASGAKILLQPGGPAKYKYLRDHGKESTPAQRLGTVAHGLVLGVGADVHILEYENRRTKKCQEEEAEARKAGKLPVLRKEHDEARAIADALLMHPTARGLLEGCDPEVSMFWQDPEFLIWLRLRADALSQQFGVPLIGDVKTSADASPAKFAKSVKEYGYYQQDPWYREGWAHHLGCDWREIDFVFIVVESDPPHLVACYRIDDLDLGDVDVRLGREQNRIAREKFRDCTLSGTWPGYSQEIEPLSLRHWDRKEIESEINDWHR